MQYEKAVEGVVSPKHIDFVTDEHAKARARANDLLRALSWDDLMLLSMVDWNAAMEIRAAEGRKVRERIQKHLDAPPEPLSEA